MQRFSSAVLSTVHVVLHYRRQEVEAGLLHKADCEREALRWVEYLLEPGISGDQLLQVVGVIDHPPLVV